MQRECPVIVVLMGPAGVGKTTVGRALATTLGWPFVDADDLHAPAAVARMSRGETLTDADRQPWLERVREVMDRAIELGTPLVVACSALRVSYRAVLSRGIEGAVTFVSLEADRALLAQRLEERVGHFAHRDLLDSQLATLERPSNAIALDASLPVPTLVAAIRRALHV
jgi:gluconokinase